MHYPVLLRESIDLLDIKPNGIYIDGTFGRGGHSLEILKSLCEGGLLIAFDKDPDAIKYAKEKLDAQTYQEYLSAPLEAKTKLVIINDSFAKFDQYLKLLDIKAVDGILLDLGVSSPQIDDGSRGFSFRFDAKLDMRMDNSQGISARVWINQASEKEISRVIWEYGEERYARKIAANIVARRATNPIVTTNDLVKIVKESVLVKVGDKNPATRTFQAIRIYINKELEDLQVFLDKFATYLNSDARVVAISFHSLEDRLVKNAFNRLALGEKLPKWVTKEPSKSIFEIVGKKIRASLREINQNSRSESAIMRALKKNKT